jgi:hypothetical protein
MTDMTDTLVSLLAFLILGGVLARIGLGLPITLVIVALVYTLINFSSF